VPILDIEGLESKVSTCQLLCYHLDHVEGLSWHRGCRDLRLFGDRISIDVDLPAVCTIMLSSSRLSIFAAIGLPLDNGGVETKL
jgi:hypothetical protein